MFHVRVMANHAGGFFKFIRVGKTKPRDTQIKTGDKLTKTASELGTQAKRRISEESPTAKDVLKEKASELGAQAKTYISESPAARIVTDNAKKTAKKIVTSVVEGIGHACDDYVVLNGGGEPSSISGKSDRSEVMPDSDGKTRGHLSSSVIDIPMSPTDDNWQRRGRNDSIRKTPDSGVFGSNGTSRSAGSPLFQRLQSIRSRDFVGTPSSSEQSRLDLIKNAQRRGNNDPSKTKSCNTNRKLKQAKEKLKQAKEKLKQTEETKITLQKQNKRLSRELISSNREKTELQSKCDSLGYEVKRLEDCLRTTKKAAKSFIKTLDNTSSIINSDNTSSSCDSYIDSDDNTSISEEAEAQGMRGQQTSCGKKQSYIDEKSSIISSI